MNNNKILEARKKKNLTQEELGKRVGVTKSAVMKWEKGIVENIKRSVIIKLSQELDISPLDILGINKPDHQQALNPIPKPITLSATDQSLLSDFHKLNSHGQEKALDYIHDLTENPKYTEKESSALEETGTA